MDQVQAAPAAPTQAPPSGFLSSEFILTLIGVIGAAWAGLADKLPPQTAAIIATVAIGVYCIARTGLKMAHALGYAKAFPDLPGLAFGAAAKQAGFAAVRMLLVLALVAAVGGSLIGCAQLGLATPQTLQEQIAYDYGALAAARTAGRTALQAGQIKADDARQVEALADQVRAALDAANAVSGTDTTTAQGKLALAAGILAQVQQFLASKGIK